MKKKLLTGLQGNNRARSPLSVLHMACIGINTGSALTPYTVDQCLINDDQLQPMFCRNVPPHSIMLGLPKWLNSVIQFYWNCSRHCHHTHWQPFVTETQNRDSSEKRTLTHCWKVHPCLKSAPWSRSWWLGPERMGPQNGWRACKSLSRRCLWTVQLLTLCEPIVAAAMMVVVGTTQIYFAGIIHNFHIIVHRFSIPKEL